MGKVTYFQQYTQLLLQKTDELLRKVLQKNDELSQLYVVFGERFKGKFRGFQLAKKQNRMCKSEIFFGLWAVLWYLCTIFAGVEIVTPNEITIWRQ